MKTIMKAVCALVLGVPIAVTAAPLSNLDSQVVAHQHAVNQTEIEMGKLAQANGGAGVKKYGATLVKDHTQGDKDVAALAKTKGLAPIPADQAVSDADKKEQADMKAKLKAKKGAEFDKMFVEMMASAHDREITKLTADAAVVSDADLKALLEKTKPVLQQHSDAAKALEGK